MLDINKLNNINEDIFESLFNNQAGSLSFFRTMAWDSFMDRVTKGSIINDATIERFDQITDSEPSSLNFSPDERLKDSLLIVFVDGEFQDDLSNIKNEENIRVLPIKRAFEENESLSQLMLSGWSPDEALESEIPFFVSALANSGSIIHIKDNISVDEDIVVMNIYTGSRPVLSKNFIWLRDNVEANIIESTISTAGQNQKNYSFWEISLGRSSKLKMESFCGKGVNVAKYFDYKLSSSTTATHYTSSEKVDDLWSTINVDFVGDQATFNNFGASDLINGSKETNKLYSQLNTSDCKLNQNHKSVSAGKSSYHWDSIVEIGPSGSGSNTKQYCKAIVLDSSAKCFGKPQLMIENQNVEAGHGFAKGGVDQNKLKYLLSRGIEKDKAVNILVDAHLNEVKKEMRCHDFEH